MHFETRTCPATTREIPSGARNGVGEQGWRALEFSDNSRGGCGKRLAQPVAERDGHPIQWSAGDVAPSSRRRKRCCCRQPSRRAAPLRGRMLAGYAKSLPVLLRGVQSLFTVGERTCDGGLQAPVPVFKGCTAFFWNSLRQISNERVHAPHDLHAGGAIKADLIKSQPNEIVPCRKWNHESQLAVAVTMIFQFPSGVGRGAATGPRFGQALAPPLSDR